MQRLPWRKSTPEPEAKLPPLSTIKNPDNDVIIIHNVGERRAIYCAPIHFPNHQPLTKPLN